MDILGSLPILSAYIYGTRDVKQTWSNHYVRIVFEVSDEAWYPSVQVVRACTNTAYHVVPCCICLCPELIALITEINGSLQSRPNLRKGSIHDFI